MRGPFMTLLLLATIWPPGKTGTQPTPTPLAPGASHARALLASSPCGPQALATLDSWSAHLDHALSEPPDPTGARSVRMPSSTLGAWVRLALAPDGALTLERITAARADRRHFDPGCRVDTHTSLTRSVPDPDSFTDLVLAQTLASVQAGVILLWSPHMPLSVDEHAELRYAAAALNLSFVSVLDPGADLDYARRVARERGLPASVLARLASIELAFRGMTTHAPSMQVFANGQLVGPVIYGYRDRAAARTAIAALLPSR